MSVGIAKVQAAERAVKALQKQEEAKRIATLEAELAAQAEYRMVRRQSAERMAAAYLKYLEAEFGNEVAREAWAKALPKKRRGFAKNEANPPTRPARVGDG